MLPEPKLRADLILARWVRWMVSLRRNPEPCYLYQDQRRDHMPHNIKTRLGCEDLYHLGRNIHLLDQQGIVVAGKRGVVDEFSREESRINGKASVGKQGRSSATTTVPVLVILHRVLSFEARVSESRDPAAEVVELTAVSLPSCLALAVSIQ